MALATPCVRLGGGVVSPDDACPPLLVPHSPVRSQNDANEFFSLLLDRLGSAFGPPKTLHGGDAATDSVSSNGRPKDIFEVSGHRCPPPRLRPQPPF